MRRASRSWFGRFGRRKKKPEPLADPARRDRHIRLRMIIVGLVLATGITMAVGRTAVLQFVHGDQLKREASWNYVRTRALDDWRGDIVDRNGALLGVSVHRWALTADPHMIQRPELTASVLGELLEIETESLERKLSPVSAEAARLRLNNRPIAAARRYVQPYVNLMSEVFEIPDAHFERTLDLLEYFYQMEQLQVPGIHEVARVLARAADAAISAISSGAESLRFLGLRGRRFAYLARDLNDEQADLIGTARDRLAGYCREQRREGRRCTNPLSFVYLRPEAKRYYPKRELGAQILGQVAPDGKGNSGLERALDGILAGRQRAVRTVRDRRGRDLFLDGISADAPLAGNTIELTIDDKIQAIAERELRETCLISGARAGYALVMRVKTGEILAAANFPTYNPNTYTDWYRERAPLNRQRSAFAQARDDMRWASTWAGGARAYPDTHERVSSDAWAALTRRSDAFVEYDHSFPDASRAGAFVDVYEPGSIMKVFTIAAAMDAGVLSLDRQYELEKGVWRLDDPDDTRIHDTSPMAKGDVAAIIRKSSNIGAAKIGFDLGAEKLEEYLRRFGFGGSTGSGFPGEASGLLVAASEWGVVELANISFGQGMATTGVQLAAGLSALGNDGVLMKPLLVRRLLDPSGEVLTSWDPEAVHRVVAPRVARTVVDLMQGVVAADGTGRRAYIPKYPVAGKTGTGQKSHLRKRGYAENMWVNTFFGLAPAESPELAVVVLVDEPKGKRHGGGLFAAPAFRQIMEKSLTHLGVPSPYDAGTQVASLDPEYLQARRQMASDATRDFDHLRPPIDGALAGDVPVPDFRGQTMDMVHRSASSLGLKVRYVGTGVVQSQDLVAYERYPLGSVITVTMARRGHDPMIRAPAGPTIAPPPGDVGGMP